MISQKEKNALIHYVTEQSLPGNNKHIITQLCQKQPPQTRIVYRGHSNGREIRKALWFSTTSTVDVARSEFSSNDGVVFIIHTLNVPMIDVNLFIREQIKRYGEEDEFILLGGGVFYKDKQLTSPGFVEISKNVMECYYTFDLNEKNITDDATSPSKSISAVQRAFEIIPEDEYEYIHSADDVYVSDDIQLSDSEKAQVFQLIQRHLKKGGRRVQTKPRKTKKNNKPETI